MRRVLGIVAVAVFSALSSGCGQQTEQQQLVITGSSTVAPLGAELAKAYEAAHPNVRIDVQSGGSSRGMNDVRKGLADIGMVSRALNDDEGDLTTYTIAYDGIGMIVNSANPVRSLSREQIIAIYTNGVNSWAEVGGPEQTIVVVNKAEGRSTLVLFLKFFGLKSADVVADVVIGDNQQGLKTVAGNPWAIGYVSIGSAEYEVAQGQPIRLLPLADVEASTAAVREGRFPLSRPLNFVTSPAATGLAEDFINFARSPDVHAIVEQQFFIPVDHP